MTDGVLPINPGVVRPERVGSTRPLTSQQTAGGTDFAQVLQGEVQKGQDLKFSAHAEKRIQSRRIPFTPAEMADLRSAVDRAAAKGAKESLILMRDMAFIVSVRNRTVITAIDGSSMRENVFTNIDSAVIA